MVRGAAVAASAAEGGDASRPQRYSIVAPTYNEAENVPLLVALVHEVCSAAGLDYEIVIVDDASPDGTADVRMMMGSRWEVGLNLD
jgi:dolichol-phosphate mannosyltransferase